ncbi:unnamed protein product [Ostreobium quekettii]|uniref:NADP-dependent oxidoreductase domain-containing protein n=1 Tax=Ostreobium quekettii TaxID=121088 RepID=A0A8S1IZ39_9CHLO|nr:unnamed protein product [Ostreobium quekettii]|eukprot:evm.model.scf_395.5 EVM.evm.TU.scf_395.5   scf_395:55114-57577(-)
MSAKLPRVPLGQQGMMVSAQGLGCMGMSAAYGGYEGEEAQSEALAVIDRALELGCTCLDTAEVYGPYTNEELVGRAIKGRADQFQVCTKFGFKFGDGQFTGFDSTPANVRKVCEESMKRLGVDCIDLFYQHRVDPNTPIEDTIRELKALVEEGKVKYIGLSEASAADIRKAHAIHPITAYQLEWSLWTRDAEKEIIPTCRELGIGLVAYSPLGRGFLTGAIAKPDDLSEDDWRRSNPRFTAEAMEKNKVLVDKVRAIAEKKGCTAAQVALAWVHHQGSDVVPIPGTKRVKYLLDNIGAYNVKLSAEDMEELNFAGEGVAGDRYTTEHMKAFTFHYGAANV